MAKPLTVFTLKTEGADPVEVPATKMDTIIVERQTKRPIIADARAGYFEPILLLAYQAARRNNAIPFETTFEQFVDGWDIEVDLDEDEEQEDSEGNS